MFESIGDPEARRLLEIGHLAAVDKVLGPSVADSSALAPSIDSKLG